MRPEILYPLFKPLTALPGVGPRNAKLIEHVTGGPHVVNLLWHLPTGLIDRSFQPLVHAAPAGQIATLLVTVDKHIPAPNRRLPYRVLCSDNTGTAELVFFHARPDWLKKMLPIGVQRVVSGKIEHYRSVVQITHPDHIALPEERGSLIGIEPIHGLTQGLSPKTLRRTIAAALTELPDLPQWLDEAHLEREGWAPWKESVLAAHQPVKEGDLDPLTSARQRLAYDELLASQLAMALARLHIRRQGGIITKSNGDLRARALKTLPYTLTESQKTSLKEILDDMSAQLRMLRLLQGDVGSGKTVVAAIAMLESISAGRQAALMAPTEILARQHLAALAPVFEAAGARIELLTGRLKGEPRRRLLDGLAAGDVDALVGTHALIQNDVMFADLALAVVDEQHRFGVAQRLQLAEKGQGTDVLVMTATPIPRTLTLMAYGDLDISRLTEKPAGRHPIDTRTMPLERLDEVIAGIGRAIGSGERGDRQVFWVCPLVEESEALDLAAAEERFESLGRLFPGKVGMVHGQMRGHEKDAVMADFEAGRIRILVATTVIEVGVDIPTATVMVVEHAERFGLAQLHQLRGRIGRGSEISTCVLLYSSTASETARNRLKILRETEDGFKIAEEDLRLRGAGEILGTRQSGLPAFRVADISAHSDLMQIARDDAALILEKDPGLATARGKALRVLLYLFERDAAVTYARSG